MDVKINARGGRRRHHITLLEVGDQVVVVVSMRSGQRFIKRCKAAKTAAGAGTVLAK